MRIIIYMLIFILCSCHSDKKQYEYIEKNQAFRSSVKSGNFMEVSNGFTYYEYSDNRKKQTIVLVHGFSVPSYIWDVTYKEAINREYNVLRMDLFGRGNSDNPDAIYNNNLFANQVIELMDSLQIRDNVILIGLSNGGGVASQIANNIPQKIKEIIYVSSSGFKELTNLDDRKIVTDEEIEYFILEKFPSLAKGQLEDFYDSTQFEGWDAKYEELLKYKGFAKALLSTARNRASLDSTHIKIRKLNIKTSAIWGADDSVVPFKVVEERIKLLLPNMKNYILEECGHLPHMEQEEKFNDILFNQILK